MNSTELDAVVNGSKEITEKRKQLTLIDDYRSNDRFKFEACVHIKTAGRYECLKFLSRDERLQLADLISLFVDRRRAAIESELAELTPDDLLASVHAE